MSILSSRKLSTEAEKLDIITEHMREGAILLHSKNEVLFINPAARMILKLPKTEQKGEVILQAFQKKFPGINLGQCIESTKLGHPLEVPETESDSHVYQIRFSRVSDKRTKVGHYTLIWIEDITENKMLERRKSEFVSVVAHQLRTPLSGLKWTLHMLIKGDFGEVTDEQKTFLMKSYENNERMIALVNDMLAADRIESSRMKYNFLRINIRDLVENVLFEVFPSAQARGVKIDFDCSTEDRFIALVDPTKIRAVIQNLLENSIKYTIEGGKVTIRLELIEGNIKITIIDTGIGIPESQQVQIFTRFFRAGNAVKMSPSGSGLGLYMVKKIVEEHGGKIWFESKEKVGSSFFVTIPTIKKDKFVNKISL